MYDLIASKVNTAIIIRIKTDKAKAVMEKNLFHHNITSLGFIIA